MFPRSHKFQAQFSLLHRATKIVAFKENYQQPVSKKIICKQQSWRIPKWLIATSLAISKQSHILHSLQAPQRYLSCRPAGYKKNLPVAWLNHPKPVQVCQDRCINGLDQEKPVIPTQKAYWTRTVVLLSTLQGLLKYEITSPQVKSKNDCSDPPSIW